MAEGILNTVQTLEADIGFDVYSKAETDARLELKADKIDTYTKTEVDNALALKADSADVYTKTESDNKYAEKATTLAGYGITDAYTITETDNALALKANIASPTFTGTPKAPTASAGTNTTQIATTAFVTSAVKVPADRLEKLISILDGQIYDYETVADVSYTKTVPAGAVEHANLDMIGGKTVVMNQLIPNGNFADGTTNWSGGNGGTLSVSDGIATVTGTATTYIGATIDAVSRPTSIAGHKYLICATVSTSASLVTIVPTGGSSGGTLLFSGLSTTPTKIAGFWVAGTSTSLSMYIRFSVTASGVSETVTGTMQNYQCIDLTLLFGSGNEPTTVQEFQAMFPASYYSYNAGQLLSADVTSVVSKDADNTTIDTYNIPADIQALSGYGWSCPNHYNYIDFENKTFVQEVDSRAYASGDESDATVITDGTTTYYPLNPAVETDISAYLTDDTIQVESGGTLTMVNSHGDDYRISIPNTETFLIDLEYALDH